MFMEGMVFIGGVPVDYHRIIMVIVGILLVGGLWLFPFYQTGAGTPGYGPG
ncbi:MAG: hypothetical protein U5K27_10025 [Desulfotignum sp.]|nr:hypothetical protein [Desulfotignum sp.]